MAINIERSSGNVFRDLGFGPKEAESLRLRAELMVELRRLIQARKLTQNSAAKLFGVTQPRISDLVRGRIDLFSIETLVNMLARVGIRVRLRLTRSRGASTIKRHNAPPPGAQQKRQSFKPTRSHRHSPTRVGPSPEC